MYKRQKDYKGKSTPERFELLTKSESKIMRLTGQGFSTGDIAAKMGITRSTVDSFRVHTIKKLNIQRSTYGRWAFKLATDAI